MLKEVPSLIFSRFRIVLRIGIRGTVTPRDVKNLEEAYQLSLDLYAFPKGNPRSPSNQGQSTS